MIGYRLHSDGVVRIQDGEITFIERNPAHPEWQEFELWRALGNEPLPPTTPKGHLHGFETLRPLYIIGAGGYGRELVNVLKGQPGYNTCWEIAGFLNDIPVDPAEHKGYPPVVGNTDYDPQPGDLFVCAIGDPQARRRLCEKFRAKGAEFLNRIAPEILLHPTATVGNGVNIEGFVAIGAHSRVGHGASILSFSVIGHDCEIGNYAQISPSASILGRVRIGEGAMIGAGATILPGVSIGADATVGAGSTVLHDVPDGAKVFGVPARRMS